MQRTNEHHLPQFLMKGFASRVRGDSVNTLWFRKGSQPLECNIKNIATEKDFHSSVTGSSADDTIKPLEDQFGWYVDALRQQPKDCQLDDPVVPELIANLSVRTKAFRQEMVRTVVMAMREVIARLHDPECMNTFASKILREPSYRIFRQLAKYSPDYADALIEQVANNPDFFRSPIVSLLAKTRLDKVERSFETEFVQAAKESHVHALSRDPVPTTIIEALAHLHWHIVARGRGTFILGEVGPVFKIENRNAAKAVPIGLFQYDAAFLPISDTHLLAGFEDRNFLNLSEDQINRFSSSCSPNFFIAAFNRTRERDYSLQIGLNPNLLDQEMVTTIADLLLS